MQSDMIEKSIVIFGAGKIGRSFIGQLFGCGGYQVVFIDVEGLAPKENIKAWVDRNGK
jgi:mannitol-1-phosphate/altronate dehydrogenase